MDVIAKEEEELREEDAQRASAPSLEVCKPRRVISWQGTAEGTRELSRMLEHLRSSASLLEAPGGTNSLIFVCGHTRGPHSYPFPEFKEKPPALALSPGRLGQVPTGSPCLECLCRHQVALRTRGWGRRRSPSRFFGAALGDRRVSVPRQAGVWKTPRPRHQSLHVQ